MIDLIAPALGIIPATIYIGYFAIKVPSVPLTIIIVATIGLMIYSFFSDRQNAKTIARIRAGEE
jgi:hypothetical protein